MIRSPRSTILASAAAIAATSLKRRCSARPSIAPTSSSIPPAGTAQSRACAPPSSASSSACAAVDGCGWPEDAMDAVISSPTLDTRRPTAIAVMAMGGQGGGVLVDWIVALIEGQGWLAQSTSVPGVAQRTGATIYYVEALE